VHDHGLAGDADLGRDRGHRRHLRAAGADPHLQRAALGIGRVHV